MSEDIEISYTAEPTLARFHASDKFVRGIRGPIGTGKSVGMCMEIFSRALRQEAHKGVRRSRWAAIRNTYPELKSTTINTWEDWIPSEISRITWDSPITAHVAMDVGDGTTMELEVLFISLDRPADVKKLKSLELTGAWLNEASELPKAALDMATGRVGRFPGNKDGGASWSGVIMDTNSPDDDHWWYELAETSRPEGFEFFAQPGALLLVDGHYIPNPEAENVQNHRIGYEYWLRQVPGKADHWIKVFILGQYGSVHDGKPVYNEWNDGLHVKEITPIPNRPLKIGIDFGLTPAAIITQTDTRGRFLVLDELCSNDMGIRSFLTDVLIPQLMTIYPEWYAKKDEMIFCYGDPAGSQRSQTDEKSCFEEIKAAGLKIKAAESNAWLPRRGSVAWFLSKLADGKPMFLLDPVCQVLRKGFNGGYKYRRIQVTGDERYTDEPMKNQYSHPHDALQYVAMEAGGIQATKRTERKPVRVQEYGILDSSIGL